LTEKGRALDESLKNDIHSLENGMVHDFSTEERALLHSFLLRMAKNLDEIERKRV